MALQFGDAAFQTLIFFSFYGRPHWSFPISQALHRSIKCDTLILEVGSNLCSRTQLRDAAGAANWEQLEVPEALNKSQKQQQNKLVGTKRGDLEHFLTQTFSWPADFKNACSLKHGTIYKIDAWLQQRNSPSNSNVLNFFLHLFIYSESWYMLFLLLVVYLHTTFYFFILNCWCSVCATRRYPSIHFPKLLRSPSHEYHVFWVFNMCLWYFSYEKEQM